MANSRVAIVLACIWLALLPARATAQGETADRPDLAAIVARPRSEMAPVVTRFAADRASLSRMYDVRASPARRDRFERFYAGWLDSMSRIDFGRLGQGGKADYVLLRNLLMHEQRDLEIERKKIDAALVHAPFAPIVFELAEARRRLEPVDARRGAARLEEVRAKADEARKAFEEALKPGPDGKPGVSASDARVVLDVINGLKAALNDWRRFYDGYDPAFSWWTAQPARAADQALDQFARVVREKGVGVTPDNPNVIVGVPIGREALLSELAFEMIPYTPEELIAIAERELAWCRAEQARAAADLGVADWKAALEVVKADHVSPGEQPALIRDLAVEAIAWVKDRGLITIPPMGEETWRMAMMSPERQLQTPFFTGGEVISVAFPTSGMDQAAKEMALRANNIHFSRATVFHELYPGHGLQQFVGERNQVHREPFATPFWTEGWALYWEMLLWDKGFHDTPKGRTGALFWRSHRCARIICSLKYHLGEMTTQEWIDFLADQIGHERSTAEGEVRRSVSGAYGPLYQVAYMIGGLQFRALHAELVGSGRMSDREFHDRVMLENNIPVEMVRALLVGAPLSRDYQANWRFDAVK